MRVHLLLLPRPLLPCPLLPFRPSLLAAVLSCILSLPLPWFFHCWPAAFPFRVVLRVLCLSVALSPVVLPAVVSLRALSHPLLLLPPVHVLASSVALPAVVFSSV